MNYLDTEQNIVLNIYDAEQEYTTVKVEVQYLNKTLEVKIPNDVQVGYKIRIKGYGKSDINGERGDLFLIVVEKNDMRNITDAVVIESKTSRPVQKLILVDNDNFEYVNGYLANGWRVVDFKPYKRNNSDFHGMNVYVLIEKQ